ncbi:glycosyltransferase [Azospirillum sp. sgz302134]
MTPCAGDLAGRLGAPIRSAADLTAIASVCEALRKAGPDPSLEPDLRRAVPDADPVLVDSALALATGDLRHFVRILNRAEAGTDALPLEVLNHLFWSINRQLFMRAMDLGTVPDFVTGHLLPFYERLVSVLVRRLDLRPTRREAGAPPTGRAVLVTNQFLSANHQPSRDVLDYAAMLEDRIGKEVVILNTNMMPTELYSLFVPPFAASIEPQFDGKQIIDVDGRSYRMLSSTERAVSADKLGWFLAAVNWYDPDVVVSFGGGVVVADLLAGTRPTLCIPSTAGPTLSLADIVLDYGGSAPPTGSARLAKAWRPFRTGFSLRGEPGGMTRDDLGLSEDAFVGAVVGNRLDDEVDEAFLALLEEIIDRVPRAVVLFAGGVEALPGRVARSRHAGAIRCLGFVDDIRGLLGLSDVFLNPPRSGGGGSAAHALADGVPPVSLGEGDVASVAGPSFTVPDRAAYVERAVALAENPALLAEARAEARARHATLTAEASGAAQLAAYIDEAIAMHGALQATGAIP